jgi:hypothetical protein
MLRSKAVTSLFLTGSVVIVTFHLAYYLWFLNRFADHRALQSQWNLPWLYSPSTYLPALFIVGALAAVRVFRWPGFMAAMGDPRVRLFAVWFTVVFALTQHNLITHPMQPIHFAHGYDWMALFFLGVPTLLAIIDRVLLIHGSQLRYCAIAILVALVLLDNLIWYGEFFLRGSPSYAINLTQDQSAVLNWLDRNTAPPDMVVSQDETVSYLVSTYTRVRSWEGHKFNTPQSQQRQTEVQQEFLTGRTLPEWERMRVFYVVEQHGNWRAPVNTVELYRNHELAIWGPR